MKLTIACGCGRKMAVDTLKGAGSYRCGCGARIRIEGLPVRSPRYCPVILDGWMCNKPKKPNADVCDTCAERITRATMRRPDLRRNAAMADVRQRFEEQRQIAIEEHTEERAKELERIREVGSLTDFNVVYYALVRPGVVKIGTTRHLPSRMSALRIEPGAVLAAEPGTQKLEAVRHRQFKHLQVGRYREDFRLTEQLQTHIDALVAKHGKAYDLSDQIVQRQRRLADERELARKAAQS